MIDAVKTSDLRINSLNFCKSSKNWFGFSPLWFTDEIREALQDNTRVYQRTGQVSQFIHHFFLARKVFPSIFPQWAYW
jgi:hypothetical protein